MFLGFVGSHNLDFMSELYFICFVHFLHSPNKHNAESFGNLPNRFLDHEMCKMSQIVPVWSCPDLPRKTSPYQQGGFFFFSPQKLHLSLLITIFRLSIKISHVEMNLWILIKSCFHKQVHGLFSKSICSLSKKKVFIDKVHLSLFLFQKERCLLFL